MRRFASFKYWVVPALIAVGAFVFLPGGAFDSKLEADLKFSRDALVRQKGELETDLDAKVKQIAQLEMEVKRTQTYLKDTDHALGLIDNTLKIRH